ncbi:MAG: hypothetical protein K2I42_06295 [Anaeroplasmataceae bacterium]|nr:hypothetical protein [Anaeroplasmataceae bacterium]
MSKVSKFLRVVMLSVCCFISISLISCSKEKQDNPNQNRLGQEEETKKKWDGSIEDEFADDAVIVYIKSEYRHCFYNEEDFSGLDLENIVCVTKNLYDKKCSEGDLPEDFTQIYFLTLKNKSKENVIEAIRKCEKLDFVEYVVPNLIIQILEPIITE